MEAKQIRSRFLDYFAERDHHVVRSSSLVPHDDPTLLFTNAGMNQFKSVLIGLEKRDYIRATSVQKCMRVSGKHNDLEEVGQDARHHTFFEMLGNWSFGDYYKEDAIIWGWDFLTREMGLPAERLWASVYKDDDESFGIWEHTIGISPERIKRLGDLEKGDDENFWAMADTGPCGPCTEIHYDQGVDMACDHPSGCALGVCDCDRWLELWNLVFMEFDRDAAGRLNPLPMKSVDTGLGFERLVAVMQEKRSNYESDLFTPLIAETARLSGKTPEGAARISMQVIADHARAVGFTLADGAVPSADGRGYVVRRILRRAARHGRLLDLREPFLWRVADVVITTMQEAYPELSEQRQRILRVIRQEEERFNRTLDSGLQIYAEIRKRMQQEERSELSGGEAFRLHDTYGFPVDLTAVVAREDGLTVDEAGFSECMTRQRAASGSERIYKEGLSPWQPVRAGLDLAGFVSEFVGYQRLEMATEAVAIRQGGQDEAGQAISHLLFEQTPFYAESGGQIGDTGIVRLLKDGSELEVLTTVQAEQGPACIVQAPAEELHKLLGAGNQVQLCVDPSRRQPTMRHHTATHLLHAALRQVLGDHVEQAGSEVTPEKLRFDFRHDAPLRADELTRVEQIVNTMVLANTAVQVHRDVPLKEAKARGAMALFGEKYADTVRMIEIPAAASGIGTEANGADGAPTEVETFSLELCGGTHVTRTGDVGLFRITSQSASAAGVRRIEAVAGEEALARSRADRAQLQRLGTLLRADGGLFADQVDQLLAERDLLRKQMQQNQHASAQAALADALAKPLMVGDLKIVAARVEAEDRDSLMKLGDHVRDKLTSGVVALAAAWGDKVTLIVTVTSDLVAEKRLHAGNLVKELALRVGGRGGGRPHMAQAGLPDVGSIEPVLAAVADVVRDCDPGHTNS